MVNHVKKVNINKKYKYKIHHIDNENVFYISNHVM